ncbi:MAG: hypothetical protein R3B45_12465 [Bdellovibrionota bacterium]
MDNLIAFSGYILAAMSLCLAFILWRKSSQLHAVLMEAISRNEMLDSTLAQQQKTIAAMKEAQHKNASATENMEKNIKSHKARAESLAQELERAEQSFRVSIEKERTQVERYSSEVKALTKQLVELDHERKHERTEVENKYKEENNSTKSRLAELEMHNKKLQEDIKKLAASNSKLESILKKVDPKEMAKTKRKVKQYSQLFHIMKGQKEMAEELAANWESALKQTAAWIIKNDKRKREIPEKIGPLVGMAMEIIGGSIIDEAEQDYKNEDIPLYHSTEHETDLEKLIVKAQEQITTPIETC